MRRFLILAILLLAGCGVTTPAPAVTLAQPPPLPTDSSTDPAILPIHVLHTESGDLQITLFSGMETETAGQLYLLKGEAPAGTVLTVNAQILVVDQTGSFNVEVPLEEGPNLVEVIASNAVGDIAEFLLTIYYNL